MAAWSIHDILAHSEKWSCTVRGDIVASACPPQTAALTVCWLLVFWWMILPSGFAGIWKAVNHTKHSLFLHLHDQLAALRWERVKSRELEVGCSCVVLVLVLLLLLLLLHCVWRLKCLFVKMEMQQAAHTSNRTVAECLRQAYFGWYSGGVMNGLGSPTPTCSCYSW